MQTATFTLKNLHCQACVKVSQMKIAEIPGVQEVYVDLSGKTVIVASRPISKEEVQASLADTEYEVV